MELKQNTPNTPESKDPVEDKCNRNLVAVVAALRIVRKKDAANICDMLEQARIATKWNVLQFMCQILWVFSITHFFASDDTWRSPRFWSISIVLFVVWIITYYRFCVNHCKLNKLMKNFVE